MKKQQLEELNDLVYRCNYLQCAFNVLRETIYDTENKIFSADELHDTLIIYTTYLDHIADDLQEFYDKMESKINEVQYYDE